MSYALHLQNEALETRLAGPESDESRDVAPPAFRVPMGGFFSDVVWVERRHEDESRDARDAG